MSDPWTGCEQPVHAERTGGVREDCGVYSCSGGFAYGELYDFLSVVPDDGGYF